MKLQQKSIKDSIGRRPLNAKHPRREMQARRLFEDTDEETSSSSQGFSPSMTLSATSSPALIRDDNADEQWSFASGAFVVIG